MTASTGIPHTDHAACSCQGDVADWYVELSDVIWQFTYTRTGDVAAADDCTSETFLRALAGQTRFRCQGRGVRPWLFTIARNVVHDHHRRFGQRPDILPEDYAGAGDAGADPARMVMSREIGTGIEQCVASLPADQQRCFRLRFFDHLSVDETAAAMHRTNRAVRALQYRARRKVVAMLVDSGIGERPVLADAA